MPSSSTRVTVGALLRARAETLSLGLELLAGAGGLERGVTSPYVLKTGLALAGFDSYLQEGRVLVMEVAGRQCEQGHHQQSAEHPQPAHQRNVAMVVLAPARHVHHPEQRGMAAEKQDKGGRYRNGQKLKEQRIVHGVDLL